MSAPVTDGPPSSGRPLVTVVLPAYRAAAILDRHVPLLQDHLRSRGVPHEVIVVDDGSQDDGQTEAVARRLGCRYIGLPRNSGKGAAVRCGMIAATGRYRIYTDADVPFALDTFDSVLRYLDFKEFDVVAGDRTLTGSVYFTEVPLVRRIGSAVCSTLVGRFLAGGWFDTQCGIKGFRDEVASDLFSVSRVNRFAFDVELLYVALKRNYDIKRIPVRLRSNDTSSVRLLNDGVRFALDLVRIRWNQFLGRYQRVTVR